jgi:hypothetical protein
VLGFFNVLVFLGCYDLLWQLYAPQTKILDCRTNVWERFSKYLSKGEYSIWATLLWNYFETAFPNVRSDFQNFRLGSIKFLQKIVSSQKTNTSPRMLLSFVIILQSCYKRSSQETNTSQR